MPRQKSTPDNPKSPLVIAAAHLRERGHQVLAEGFRKQPIDIVSTDGAVLVFTSVKQLASTTAPADYVTERQRIDVRKAAARWLAANPHPHARELRFDSIAISFSATGRLVRLDHVEGLY